MPQALQTVAHLAVTPALGSHWLKLCWLRWHGSGLCNSVHYWWGHFSAGEVQIPLSVLPVFLYLQRDLQLPGSFHAVNKIMCVKDKILIFQWRREGITTNPGAQTPWCSSCTLKVQVQAINLEQQLNCEAPIWGILSILSAGCLAVLGQTIFCLLFFVDNGHFVNVFPYLSFWPGLPFFICPKSGIREDSV